VAHRVRALHLLSRERDLDLARRDPESRPAGVARPRRLLREPPRGQRQISVSHFASTSIADPIAMVMAVIAALAGFAMLLLAPAPLFSWAALGSRERRDLAHLEQLRATEAAALALAAVSGRRSDRMGWVTRDREMSYPVGRHGGIKAAAGDRP
jgi:hypothetical protein